MKLKNESFYDPGLRDTGITASEYRKEYTRLYTNYTKRMTALKSNGFAWTETYKNFKGIPKPSQLKSERGIRNNLKSLYDFFNNPMTSTRVQQRARNTIIEQFNAAGVPLKKDEYEAYMKFLNWLAATFKTIGFSSGFIYTAYQNANNATSDKRPILVYYQFAKQNNLKLDDATRQKMEEAEAKAEAKAAERAAKAEAKAAARAAKAAARKAKN